MADVDGYEVPLSPQYMLVDQKQDNSIDAPIVATVGAPGGTGFFKMRAEEDPGPGYTWWVSVGGPDFLGVQADVPIIPGTAVHVSTWF